jgi:hypothetical protein
LEFPGRLRDAINSPDAWGIRFNFLLLIKIAACYQKAIANNTCLCMIHPIITSGRIKPHRTETGASKSSKDIYSLLSLSL